MLRGAVRRADACASVSVLVRGLFRFIFPQNPPQIILYPVFCMFLSHSLFLGRSLASSFLRRQLVVFSAKDCIDSTPPGPIFFPEFFNLHHG